jgi:tetratricopeptide (TPR) repeat protein
MYKLFVLTIICMACNSNGKKGQQPASGQLMSFFKNEVNPLLQNLETTAAKGKLDSMLPVIKESDNYVEMCSWLRCMAVAYQLENKLDSARWYVDRSLQLAFEKDTTERQILAGKIQTASILSDYKSLDSALGYAREAYFLAKRIDTPGLPFICLKLYDIYEKIGDLDMQKKYLFEGFNRSTSSKHKTVFATNISAYYDRVNQVDSALVFFQALMKDTTFSNPYYDAVRYESLGALLSKKGNLEEGLYYQLKGMQISRTLDELNAQSYYNVAATYRKLGEYKKDEALLDTALSFVSHEKDWALQKKIWRGKAENLVLQEKPLPAYEALDSAFVYYQKEVDFSIIRQARELEAKYSLLEKDNQIKSLALSNEVSERARERQRNTFILIILGSAILGMIALGMWWQKQFNRNVREASLRQQLLRGQIESHFLYNSVNGLQRLIRKGNTEGATEFVEQLALLFRLSLENARGPFVPLKNELDALESYLTLQQSLFDDQFDYHIKVKGITDQEAILIPPMLLQPFTENAILHGFNGQKEKGLINICIQKNHKALHCVIEDNGRGFQVVDNHSQKRPLSTVINKERLEILSRQTKTHAHLKVIDKKETDGVGGVRVELVVPYVVGNEGEVKMERGNE